jgi:hypothetical protein
MYYKGVVIIQPSYAQAITLFPQSGCSLLVDNATVVVCRSWRTCLHVTYAPHHTHPQLLTASSSGHAVPVCHRCAVHSRGTPIVAHSSTQLPVRPASTAGRPAAPGARTKRQGRCGDGSTGHICSGTNTTSVCHSYISVWPHLFNPFCKGAVGWQLFYITSVSPQDC